MLFSNGVTTNLLSVIVAFIAIIIIYYKWAFSYWKRRGVPTRPPSIPFGNFGDMFRGKVSFGQSIQQTYNYFKQQGLPYGGLYFFTKKFLIITDPDILKNIMIKDFPYFMNHGAYVNEDADPLTGILPLLEDEKWRALRVKLTPTFTSGKMKMMFETLANCTIGLNDKVTKYADNKTAVDIKEVLSCFTTDIIGSVAFGIECNAQKDPNSEFRKFGKKIIETSLSWRNFIAVAFPRWFLYLIRFRITNQEVEDFSLKLIEDTVNYREENNIMRKDFMHLLIQLKNGVTINDNENEQGIKNDIKETGLTVKQIAAQAFAFFMAGFETSSTTMTFALYEICQNLDIQKKLREEINTVFKKYENKLCYNSIMELSYMDKVVNETLRKYPPIAGLSRECNKDYKVPGHDLIIEKNTFVSIPVHGLHYDEEYFPNPDVFDPERFNEENKASRPQCTWLPFGDGPRICIGLRFANMQTKVGLAAMLQNFEISLNKKTVVPLRYNPRTLVISTLDPIWLDFKKIG